MRSVVYALFALVFFISTPVMAEDEVYVTQSLHLRAGPDKDFPLISTLQRGEVVEFLGCIYGYNWCEVETSYNERGWVAERFLCRAKNVDAVTIVEKQDGKYVVVFEKEDYWNRYYRSKYFYKNRDQWPNIKTRPPKKSRDKKPSAPGKDQKTEPTYKKMQTPERKEYNPLCRMGQNDC